MAQCVCKPESLERGGPCWLLKPRGYKRYLGWPMAPSYMRPNSGGEGGGVSLSQWVRLYIGAQINFEDLTPYLAYGWNWDEWGLKDGKWKGPFLGWACRAGRRDFCSAWAAPGRSSTKYFFPHLTLFQFLCPHPLPCKFYRQPCWVACLLVYVSGVSWKKPAGRGCYTWGERDWNFVYALKT